MNWKDAFGAPLQIGSLVTYAMKRDGGMVYPVARIVKQAPTGWPVVEFDAAWLKEFNAPWQKHVDDAKASKRNLQSLEVLEGNLLKSKPRPVSDMSLIRIDTHPSFANRD